MCLLVNDILEPHFLQVMIIKKEGLICRLSCGAFPVGRKLTVGYVTFQLAEKKNEKPVTFSCDNLKFTAR